MSGSAHTSSVLFSVVLLLAVYAPDSYDAQTLPFGQSLIASLREGLSGITMPNGPPLGLPPPDLLVIEEPDLLVNPSGDPVNQGVDPTEAPAEPDFIDAEPPIVFDPVADRNLVAPDYELPRQRNPLGFFRRQFEPQPDQAPVTADLDYRFAASIRDEIIPVKPRSRLDIDLEAQAKKANVPEREAPLE